MATPYYIIEHPTWGVLQDEPTQTGRPRFSWAKSRAHPDNAKYSTLRQALEALEDASLPEGCSIIGSPVDGEYEWKTVAA